jgi:hypothetical protein
MPKQPSTSPFQAMEQEAYHAFLEWPVWLALREKELAAYLAAAADRPQADQGTASDAGTSHQSHVED